MPDDVPRDMPHMCREFPGRRTFIPSNPRTGGRCSLYAASERRPTSGGVPLLPRGGGPRSSPPAARAGGPGGVGWCRLTAFAAGTRGGRGGGRRGRPSGTRRDEAGQFRAAHGRSRPAGAAGAAGAGTVRGPGIKPGWRAVAGPVGRRAGGQGRGGLELPAARSLRISGPKDKKFRSRSGGGCREAGPGGCREAGPGLVPPAGPGGCGKQPGPVPASRTGAGSAQQDRGRFRPAGRGGEFRHKRTGAGSGARSPAGSGRQEARAGSADKNRPGELGRRARTG